MENLQQYGRKEPGVVEFYVDASKAVKEELYTLAEKIQQRRCPDFNGNA